MNLIFFPDQTYGRFFTVFAKFVEPFFHNVCLGFKGSYLCIRTVSHECRAGREVDPGWAGIQLISSLVAGAVLCFGWRTRIMSITL